MPSLSGTAAKLRTEKKGALDGQAPVSHVSTLVFSFGHRYCAGPACAVLAVAYWQSDVAAAEPASIEAVPFADGCSD